MKVLLRIILLVAIAALSSLLVLPVGAMIARSTEYRRKAEFYARHESVYDKLIRTNEAILERGRYGDSERKAMRERIAALEASRSYHIRMKRKYELAAARPWITVSPDPRPPE